MKIIYSTFDSHREAREIAKALVEKKIAACVNIMENKESIYSWEGKLTSEKEFIIFAKTKESLAEKAMDFIKEKHSYSLPCVLALPTEASLEYNEWVNTVTK